MPFGIHIKYVINYGTNIHKIYISSDSKWRPLNRIFVDVLRIPAWLLKFIIFFNKLIFETAEISMLKSLELHLNTHIRTDGKLSMLGHTFKGNAFTF